MSSQEQAKLTPEMVEEYIRVRDEHESEHAAWLAKVGRDPEVNPHFCDYYGCQDTSMLARALSASQTAIQETLMILPDRMHQAKARLRAALLEKGDGDGVHL